MEQHVVLVNLGRCGGELALLASVQLLRIVHGGGRNSSLIVIVLVRIFQTEWRHLGNLGMASSKLTLL